MVTIAAPRADGRDTWLGPWRLAMGGDWFVRERMLVVGAYEMVCVPAVARVNDDLVRPLRARRPARVVRSTATYDMLLG